MSWRVHSSCRSVVRGSGQLCHDISLSWQYALLLPCCVRRDLVPGEEHGNALRQEEGREEIPGLPLAEL